MTDKKPTGEIPKAVRHRLLGTIDSELRGAHNERTFEVLGHRYLIRTLDPAEESWADCCVQGDNFYQTSRNRRAPYVAAALKAVDEVPIESLFTFPSDAEELHRKLFDESEEYKRAWYRTQVLNWLIDRDKHGPYVQKLYSAYCELEDARMEALDKLDPLRKTTLTGGSYDTSSPEKESSSVTHLSAG